MLLKLKLNTSGLWLYILCIRNYIKFDFLLKKIVNRGLYLFHTVVKPKNRIGPHDQDVISIIVGSLLGDGYGNKRFVEGTRLCFRQSIIHKNYLFWLYKFFNERGYCSNLEPRIYCRILKYDRAKSKKYYGYEFNTYTFRSFDWIHKMFYKKGKKYINRNLGIYITPLALSIWISDDGGWTGNGVRIASYSFTLKEVEYLIDVLFNNFGLICNVQKIKTNNQYSIYIQSKSISNLRNIVLPHLHESMLYKIGL